MIGAKTLAVLVVAAGVAALTAALGWLEPAHLHGLTAATCLAAGLFAGLAAALVSAAIHPGLSRVGVGRRGDRVLDLPAAAQQALWAAALACLALGTFDNDATARLTGLPAALASPSPSEYCPIERAAPEVVVPAAPAVPPGCALVLRAHQLGYAKSLGSCAPRQTEVAPVAAEPEVCTRRQHDEPFGHYAWRRLARAGAGLANADPADSIATRAAEMRTKLGYLDTLIAQHLHAITSSPRASHHLWIELPDPRESSWISDRIDPPRCESRYAELPLWRGWETPSQLVDDVFGQLLFASRFGGSPGNCREYTLHWGAPDGSCRRLVADPTSFLADQDALEAVRDVLDRHRRQRELARLAADLDRPTAIALPDPRTLVSLQCFAVGGAAQAPIEHTIAIDGYPIAVREVHAGPVRLTGAGPLEVYAAMAGLLAAGHYGGPAQGAPIDRLAPAPAELVHEDYLLIRLERLRDADPFLGASWPLEQADLFEVYPLRRHLHGFVDAFRRRYFAQRGRL